MKFSRSLFLFLPLAGLWAQTPAPPPAPAPKPAAAQKPNAPVAPDKVVVTVGSEKITAKVFDQLIDTLPENQRPQARANRRQFADNLIKIKLLAQQARKAKTDQDPQFQVHKEYQIESLLAVYYINNYMRTIKLDDAEVRKYYDANRNDFERVKARHILIRIPNSRVPVRAGQKELSDDEALAKAQELRKKILGGADFAQLAKAESDDVGSGANGGELGFFGHGQMVGPFDDMAFKLKVGDVSEPVKTPFGYHVIQVQAREGRNLDEVRPEIEKRLRPQQAEQYLTDLRKQTGVTMDDSYLDAK
jgi:peptidyl-prolyl cis-trans isomerase C